MVDSDGMELKDIQTLRQECETTNNWSQLTNALLSIFGDMSTLSSSFLKASCGTFCPVDKVQAQLAFRMIKLECPPFLFKRVTDWVRKLVRQNIMTKKDQLDVLHSNAIVILFQCPVYIDIYTQTTF
ncbi:unnamed protein product [Absidia cylindrospora]